MTKKIKTQINTLVKKTRVTSAKNKLNARDQVVAWLSSFLATMIFLVTQLYAIIAQLLASVADYVIPYLQQVPQGNRPAWLAAITFLVMGLVILNKRRISGPSYIPPPLMPLPVQNPVLPSQPAPQGQPLPPGAPVNTNTSAF